MTCILAAHDGRSHVVAALAARLASALELELTVAAVYHPESAVTTTRLDPGSASRRRRGEAETATSAAHAVFADRVAVTERVLGRKDTARALVDLASEVEALVVVIGEDLDGHVARDVLRHAERPVLVVPRDVSAVPAAIETVGVAFDGSPGSRHALALAARLASATGAAVRLVTADEPVVVGTARHHARLSRDVEDAVRRWGDLVPLDTRVVRGLAGPVLRKELADVDLVVCGSRGRGSGAGALLGNVAALLTEDPVRPVLVVPAAAADRARKLWPTGLSPAGRA